jgi:hypothetical protein
MLAARSFVQDSGERALSCPSVMAGWTCGHTIRAGFGGVRRVLDPLLRLYFSAEFAAAMDEQARTEFPLLRDHLAEIGRTS